MSEDLGLELLPGGGVAGHAVAAVAWLLAWVAAWAAARRVAPPPWAGRATLLCALSPASVLAATQPGPEAPVAALLAGGALLALRTRERPQARTAGTSAALAALAPWLAVRAWGAAVLVGAAAVRWPRRRRRGLAALLAAEAVLLSATVFIAVHDARFGRPVPPGTAIDPGVPELWLGLPAVALAAVGAAELVRRRREGLVEVLPELRDAEIGATLLLAAFLALAAGVVLLGGGTVASGLPLLAAPAALGLRRLARR